MPNDIKSEKAATGIFHMDFIKVQKHTSPQSGRHFRPSQTDENLMASEIFVLTVKDRKLQSIDHAANGVDDTTGQQPYESRRT